MRKERIWFNGFNGDFFVGFLSEREYNRFIKFIKVYGLLCELEGSFMIMVGGYIVKKE